jgi:hypothetical protein
MIFEVLFEESYVMASSSLHSSLFKWISRPRLRSDHVMHLFVNGSGRRRGHDNSRGLLYSRTRSAWS